MASYYNILCTSKYIPSKAYLNNKQRGTDRKINNKAIKSLKIICGICTALLLGKISHRKSLNYEIMN
jgi:hypothetical protein